MNILDIFLHTSTFDTQVQFADKASTLVEASEQQVTD